MQRVSDIVSFRGDRLFDGAVDVEWLVRDSELSAKAAESFVFHGPSYHGATQDEISGTQGYNLVDTCTFTHSVLRRCYGLDEQPFTLAIAGYGTGKSHLAVTLASVLSNPSSETAKRVLSQIEKQDNKIGREIKGLLGTKPQSSLVIALNGMGSFDLAAEFTRNMLLQLRKLNLSTRPLEELRPRFTRAAGLVRVSGNDVIETLLENCGISSIEKLLAALDEQNETVYKAVHEFFSDRGLPIQAIGGESVKDIIDVACREYCGPSKPFGHLVILFDEFGRYTEFATIRSQIAGSGVLQQLFEGVQSNSSLCTFIGFIQFELNAYVQRIAPELRNEILRVSTRYQTAAKAYLSINLETLIASLLEKRDEKQLNEWFDNSAAMDDSDKAAADIRKWFPRSCNHHLWTDKQKFHQVIRKGCWPLSPLSVWMLYHLASAGSHLQQRSALALLANAFARHKDHEIIQTAFEVMAPVHLWSAELDEEFRTSEESRSLGSIAHSYASVMARYGEKLLPKAILILRAVVLAVKLGLQVSNKNEACIALAEFAGISLSDATANIEELENDYNILGWDANFRQFDILSDAVPRAQFLSFLKQRISKNFDEEGKSNLFVGKATEWFGDLLGDIECDFAEKHRISTREWRYRGMATNMQLLPTCLADAAQRWRDALSVDEARGTIIYCYIEPSRNNADAKAEITKWLREAAAKYKLAYIPVFVVLLCDDTQGQLGQTFAEIAILTDRLDSQELARFGNLVGAHKEKARQTALAMITDRLKEKQYVIGIPQPDRLGRREQVGSEIFDMVYPAPLLFPFDGFSTPRGNAAATCQQFTLELMRGKLDYDTAMSKPIKEKNRANQLLKEAWQIFEQKGTISRLPNNAVVKQIFKEWESCLCNENAKFVIAEAIRSICRPPYGANIASSALLFAIFLGARLDDLLIMDDGREMDVQKFVNAGVFRGNYVDLAKLEKVSLVRMGPVATEWENLMAEWGQSKYYTEKLGYWQKAIELRSRITLPPRLAQTYALYERDAQNAKIRMELAASDEGEALDKLNNGIEAGDVSEISWGAIKLLELQEKLRIDTGWPPKEAEKYEMRIQQARQKIRQIFSVWLPRQLPQSDNPNAAGRFESFMRNIICKSLHKLELRVEEEQLSEHVTKMLKKIHITAQAHQLVRDVDSWLSQQPKELNNKNLAELREMKRSAQELRNKLKIMWDEINFPAIKDKFVVLKEMAKQITEVENAIVERKQELFYVEIDGLRTLQEVQQEVRDLERFFDCLPEDINALRKMNRTLQLFSTCYFEMDQDSLSWEEFQALTCRIIDKLEKEVDEDVVWPPEETIEKFASEIAEKRTLKGEEWLTSLGLSTTQLDRMNIVDANVIYTKATTPPPLLNASQRESLDQLIQKIEKHLMKLEVDWLVDKFNRMNKDARQDFFERIGIAFNARGL